MIDRLEIRNLYSHKRTILDFSSGVNAITGTTDTGKSAIIQALRLLIFNKPAGDAARSNWGGRSSVIGWVDGHKITRERSNTTNIYKLDRLKPFKAIGTNCPVEISRIFNMKAINIQSQHDAPFLLDDSPGEVAKHFNRVARIDVIHTATKNVNAWQRDIESEIGRQETNKKELTEDLKAFENIDGISGELAVLENIYRQLIRLLREQSELALAIKQLRLVRKEKVRLLNTLKFEEKVNNLDIVSKDMRHLINERNELINLITDIKDTKHRKKQAGLRAQRYQQEFDALMPDTCPLCDQEV